MDTITPLTDGVSSILVSYTDSDNVTKTTNQPVTVNKVIKNTELDHISIITPPNKVDYLFGESFDKTGMRVDATYKRTWSDNSVDYVTSENIEFSFDNSSFNSLDITSIVISFTDNNVTKTANQSITISDAINSEVLDSIVIRQHASDLEYYENEVFDKTGLIVDAKYKQTYLSGRVDYKIVKDVKFTIEDELRNLTVADTSMVIKFKDNGVVKTVDENITVNSLIVKLRTVTIEGVLTYSDGTPIANRLIELHSTPKRVKTDSHGRYKFEDVETGEHTLTVFSNDEKTVDGVVKIFISVDLKDGNKDDYANPIDGSMVKFSTTINQNEFNVNGVIAKNENTENTENTEDTEDTEDTEVPQTSDNTNIGFYLLLLLSSMSLLSILGFKRKF